MEYSLLKKIHVACVAINCVLFVGRGVLMLAEAPLLRNRALRIVPHVNDTLLLASAVWMALLSRSYPFYEGWLTAKLIALLAYIGLGTVALSYGRSKRTRLAAWVVAQLIFGYIVLVALTHSVTPISLG
ncbi:MAG: SirB2 family protein [Betaproteobacteria bacterium]|nr:SirB2 family protein [Betaproteobacteria bacterium]